MSTPRNGVTAKGKQPASPGNSRLVGRDARRSRGKGGLAAPGNGTTKAGSSTPLARAGFVVERQTSPMSCGPTCMLSLLRWAGIESTEAECRNQHRSSGFSAVWASSTLVGCASRHRGDRPTCFRGTVADDELTHSFERTVAELKKRQEQHKRLRLEPAFQSELARIRASAFGLGQTLQMCWLFASRSRSFADNSFFLRNSDDLSSAAVMAAFAFMEGGINSGRREIRFMLELAVQAAYVDLASGDATFENKIGIFDRRRRPNSVDHVKDVELPMLGGLDDEFRQHVVREWAWASSYVHPTTKQLEEKLAARAKGLDAGFEGVDDVRRAANAIQQACADVVVLTFHVLGRSFTGDILVELLDSDDSWPFHASKFVAAIDQFFDYKHERKQILERVASRRTSRVRPLDDR